MPKQGKNMEALRIITEEHQNLWRIATTLDMVADEIDAGSKVGLKMNLPKSNLAKIIAELPALRKPTVSQLSDPAWVAVETIVDEKIVREIVPALKAQGAEGIVEYPLTKVIE